MTHMWGIYIKLYNSEDKIIVRAAQLRNQQQGMESSARWTTIFSFIYIICLLLVVTWP